MKTSIAIASLSIVLAAPSLVLAQSEIGTWKLDTAKSKWTGLAAPKSRTQTFESQAGGIKNHVQGVAGDGSAIDFTFSAKFDGTINPVTGTGAPSQADSVALKRIDANKFEMMFKKGAKDVTTAQYTISTDGKTMTIFAKGMNPDGKPFVVRAVYDKQ